MGQVAKRRLLYFIALIALAALIAGGLVAKQRLTPRPPLCLSAAEIFCKKLEKCGGIAKEQLPACVERHAADCELDIGWRLRRGILLLDREAEDECLEGLESSQCGAVASVLGDDDQDILELTDRCEMDELRPGAALGDLCALPNDCKAGTCPYAEAGCHVCKPFARLWQPCSVGGDSCEPASAWCDLEKGGGRCELLKDNGVNCQRSEECIGGACHATADGSRQCALEGASDACKDNSDCSNHSFCRPAANGGHCERRVATGAACVASGSDSVCLDGEARCIHSRCLIRPFSELEGAACLDLTDCQSGLYCQAPDRLGSAAVCARQSHAGQPCRTTDFGACEPSARCVDDQCKALAASGEKCSGPYECLAELECIPNSTEAGFGSGAACRAPSEIGEACGPYRSCRTGFCSRRGGGAICIRKAAAGAPCQSREECLSGRCQSPAAGGPSSCQGPCG